VSLRAKVKNALDEARILVLGTQVLLGFQYRSFFEPAFDKLPRFEQRLTFAGLVLLLLVIMLVMLPAARHRIVEHGRDTSALHRFTQLAVTWALIPFSLALGLDVFSAGTTRGLVTGTVLGIATLVFALAFWFGIALWFGRRPQEPDEEEEMKLEDKIVQVLTEARVVLPGAQALFGFQLAMTLMQAYEDLPTSSKNVHLASICAIACAIVFLMAPPSYHRIVERGEDTERFHTFASAMVLAAMVALPLGFAADLWVVVRKQTESIAAANVSAIVTIVVFYGVWFAAMLALRARRRTHA
jgi:heme/copper-type cytochrome/quinol oxidase subunit 2